MMRWRTLLLLNAVLAGVICLSARAGFAEPMTKDLAKTVYTKSLADGRLLTLAFEEIPLRPELAEMERLARQRDTVLRWPPIEAYRYTFRLADRDRREKKMLYSFKHLVHDYAGVQMAWGSDDVSVIAVHVEDGGGYVLLFKQCGMAHAVVGGADGVRIPRRGPGGNDALLEDNGSDAYSAGPVIDAAIDGSIAEGTLRLTFYSDHEGTVRGRFRLEDVNGKAAWKRLSNDASKDVKEELARKPKIEELLDITKIGFAAARPPLLAGDADRNAKAARAPEDPPARPIPVR